MKIAYVHTGVWPSNSPSMTFSTMATSAFAEIGINCSFFIKKASDLIPAEIYSNHFNTPKPKLLNISPQTTFLPWNKIYYDKVYRILKKEIGKN